MQTDPDSPPTENTTQRVVFFIGIGIQKEGFEGSNAMRMSIARFGSTKRNIYFAGGKMQTDPDSPPTEITTLWVVFFIGIGIQKEGFECLYAMHAGCYFSFNVL
jgi:hypothetical protein